MPLAKKAYLFLHKTFLLGQKKQGLGSATK